MELKPDRVVACRVVSRLADILEGIADPLQNQLLRTMKSARIGHSTLGERTLTETAAGQQRRPRHR